MVTQYPHRIKVSVKSGSVKDPVTGNYTKGTGAGYEFPCRAEMSKGNEEIKGVDGSDLAFSYTVYMSKTTIDLVYGSEVEIQLLNKTVKGTLKRQENGQLNTRLWV